MPEHRPSVWIVGHYRAPSGHLAIASARVPSAAIGDYQTRLDSAAASLPAGMLSCTLKILAKTAEQATERFRDFAPYCCAGDAHKRPAGRIVPSA